MVYRLPGALKILFRDFWRLRFRNEKKEGQTAETVRGVAIPNWLSAFGAPEIMEAGLDSGFTGEVFQELRTAHIIVLEAVIPLHRQSLGAIELRQGYFRSIIGHVVGNQKPNSSGSSEWGFRGNGDDSLKFPSAASWRFRAGSVSFRTDTRNADRYDGESTFSRILRTQKTHHPKKLVG